MRYVRALVGLLPLLAGVAVFILSIRNLVEIGSCGGDFQRECPGDTAIWILMIFAAVIAFLIGLVTMGAGLAGLSRGRRRGGPMPAPVSGQRRTTFASPPTRWPPTTWPGAPGGQPQSPAPAPPPPSPPPPSAPAPQPPPAPAAGTPPPQRPSKEPALPARVTLLAMTDKGATSSGNRQFAVSFQVEPSGRPPYTVNQDVWIPIAAVGTLSPGVSLPAQVDADEPNELTIDWTRPREGS